MTGYVQGVEVAHQTFDVPDIHYTSNRDNVVTFTDPGFGFVDRVEFVTTSENNDWQGGTETYQWIDNVVTGPAPITGPAEGRVLTHIDVLGNDTDADAGAVLQVDSYSATSALGAAITLNADNTFNYDPTAVAAINALGAGEALDDTFTYRIRDEFGAVSNTATVSLHVQGLNDVASVSSETKSVTEGNSAADLDTSGQLTIVDPDPGQAQVVAQTNVHGTYGDFSIDANGAWTYVGNGVHNELAGGQQYSDSFTVQSLDGSADGTVTVLIDGSYETVNLTLTNDSVAQWSNSIFPTLDFYQPGFFEAVVPESQMSGWSGMNTVTAPAGFSEGSYDGGDGGGESLVHLFVFAPPPWFEVHLQSSDDGFNWTDVPGTHAIYEAPTSTTGGLLPVEGNGPPWNNFVGTVDPFSFDYSHTLGSADEGHQLRAEVHLEVWIGGAQGYTDSTGWIQV